MDLMKAINIKIEQGEIRFEQSRSTGIIISSKVNFFDAIDGENDGSSATGIYKESGSNTKDSGEGEQKKSVQP
jgi:hypothetical protein